MPSKLSIKNQGFSVIELLAVLAIIAIVALITVPVILNVINNSNERAFLDTAYSINKEANNYYASYVNTSYALPILITYTDGKISTKKYNESGSLQTLNKNILSYTGAHPTSGNVYISVTGDVEMAIYDTRSDVCVEKKASDKVPTKSNKKQIDCVLNKTI